jgi:hypothetical protein
MATLDAIVSVQISLNTAAVQRGNFGTPLIASPLASFSELVRTYTSYNDAVSDGLPPLLLTALSDAFAQTPHPTQIKVGRLSVASVAITPISAVANSVYGLMLGTTPISVTAAATPTTSTIATQLAAAINTAAVGVTAVAAAAIVTLTFTSAIVPVTTFNKVQWDLIVPSATAGILATDLAALVGADTGWYVLLMTERTKQRVLDAAAWTETQEKMFITASSEAAILDPASTVDIISQLKAAQYFRTAISYQANALTEYPDVAWASRVLTIQPGAETWALKRLASVTPDNLTATQRNTIMGDGTTTVGKGGNTFEFYQPQIALTNPGKVAAGEWMDIIRFRDYLKNLIQTNMVQLMINRDKVPYTDGGIQLLGTNLKASLRTGQQVGGIAPDEVNADGTPNPGFNTTIPLAAEVDDVTKASRVAYFKFNARIAGAIHVADIQGALSYSLN